MRKSWQGKEKFMKNSWISLECHEKIMRKSWEFHKKIIGKSWENYNNFMRRSWERHENVMRKSWESHKKVIRKSVFNSRELEEDQGSWYYVCISGPIGNCVGWPKRILILSRAILGPCWSASLGQKATDRGICLLYMTILRSDLTA